MYHKLHLNPTEGQMHDLALGEEVKMSSHHFEGGMEMHLTTAQAKKIMKAAAAGRGCTLKFSRAQLKHHAQHGSGMFSDLIRKGAQFAAPILRKGISAGLDYGKDYLQDKIEGAAGIKQQGTGWLSTLLNVASTVAPLLGAGVGPKHHDHKHERKHKQHGKGFLGQIGKRLGHGAVDFVADQLGVGVMPNPLANPNEMLHSALFQKKMVVGQGLQI